ncbi:HIT family protein [Kitasatospora sp. NPDC048540]|uniref:HIT family protein n=1 Tax=Kitasatospora sp. NPDC048540 TaxID=3155634 RepID=UPI0033D70FED
MDCYSCLTDAALTGPAASTCAASTVAPREAVAFDEHWRVAHAFGTAVPGWLVLLPRRHVTSIAELTDTEAAGLGVWQVRLSRALVEVTGCAKTYVAQFAEAAGFEHVHFHVVPRAAGLAEEFRGPRVFGLLGAGLSGAGAAEVPEAVRDGIALRLRAALDR